VQRTLPGVDRVQMKVYKSCIVCGDPILTGDKRNETCSKSCAEKYRKIRRMEIDACKEEARYSRLV
jgi:predicted nucleic acid-binding Zn ribbon protein